MPKYSIVLPTYNSSKYLKSAIESVLSNTYQDFEFIVSNNLSEDDTDRIVGSYTDSRLRYIRPKEHLGLSSHWNFVLNHVSGEWVIGLGADDALCPFFFELADKLTQIADRNQINAIKTNRVCFYWPGLENLYGDTYVIFSASNEIEIKNMERTFKSAFYSPYGYFDIPQMYVSSMFRKSMLEKAKEYNINDNIIEPNKVFPHDAYLSCLAACLENRYLYCNVPFAWVGTSSASLGLTERQSISSKSAKDTVKNSTDNSYSKLNCTEYLLYECLNKFCEIYRGPVPDYVKEVLSDKEKLFLSLLKNNYFTGHCFFYRDFNEISKKRYSYFMEYLSKENVNPEKIFVDFKNSMNTKSINSLRYKELINLLLMKVKKRFFIKNKKLKSFNLELKKPVSYLEVNNMLSNSRGMNDIINSICLF